MPKYGKKPKNIPRYYRSFLQCFSRYKGIIHVTNYVKSKAIGKASASRTEDAFWKLETRVQRRIGQEYAGAKDRLTVLISILTSPGLHTGLDLKCELVRLQMRN